MSRHLSLLAAAADSVVRLRVRSAVMVLCLAGLLAPFLVATAIFDAVRDLSALSLQEGADLYVSLNRAGRNAPIGISWAERLRGIPGVERVVPRIVGRDYVVGPVVVLGLPLDGIPRESRAVEGALPAAPGEAVVGRAIADELRLVPGKSFTLNVHPGLRLRVTGRFPARAPLWSNRLVLVDLATAQQLFGMPGEATELLVYVRTGYEDSVYKRLSPWLDTRPDGPPLRVVSRRIALEMFRRGFTRREGFFAAIYLVAFAIAIPTLAVASGLGLSERRREIGLYRASGWQTIEVLEMVVFENVLLSLLGATVALLTAILWMKVANGFLIAQFFLPEVGIVPSFRVPATFLPAPALLAYLVALTLTMAGTVATTWRAATTPPMEVIR